MSANTPHLTTPPPSLEAADPTATALLTIDLDALCANYRALGGLASGAECAAVIKANAYGTGSERAAPALAQAGCKTFFVATFDEAVNVRKLAPGVTVYVLDGCFPGSAEAFAREAIRPVLNSVSEIRSWTSFCSETGKTHPAGLHVDTGMNRLGLTPGEAEDAFSPGGAAQGFKPALLISHLACADEPDHPKNRKQLTLFQKVRKHVSGCPASLANSGGIHLGPDYHFDLVRAGFSLYGGQAVEGRPPLSPVVQLHARIAQIHEAKAGESIGYGAAQTLKRQTRIATISLGYADGIFRNLSASDTQTGMTGYISGLPAPVLGRVSMDLITLDVTDIPESLARHGGWVEIIGPNVSIDKLAAQAGTIGYEVLTNLGNRAQRVYLGAKGSND